MTKVEQFEVIRRSLYVHGRSIREAAEEHGVHRRKVREAAKSAIPAPPEIYGQSRWQIEPAAAILGLVKGRRMGFRRFPRRESLELAMGGGASVGL